MKSMWVAIVKDKSFYGTWAGIPERSIVEWSGRFYSWPYFHGYLIEFYLYIKRKLS